MKYVFHHFTVIATLVALIALPACSTTGGLSAGNKSRAQFLNEVWVGKQIKGKAIADVYSSVYFAPVAVGHLKAQDWWSSQNVRTQDLLTTDAKNLALYTRKSLINAVNNYPTQRLQVAGQPGPHTLIIEVAITELVPAKAFWNSAATAAGFIIPGTGLLSVAGNGAFTVEGRARDGATGAVVATFRDRETDKAALVNTSSYTWYRGSELNIDELSAKAAQLLNAPAGAVVSRDLPVRLLAF